MIEQKIRDALERILNREAFENCFLVEFILHPNDKLEVFIDCAGGVTFDKCRKLSRALEEILDEELWLGERYVLEVSSPGVGKPFKHKRQYALNIGRLLHLTLHDGKELTGRLLAVDEDKITIVPEAPRKKGKARVQKQAEPVAITMDEIARAKVKVEF